MFLFFASSVFPPNFYRFWHFSPENVFTCCKLNKQSWVLTFQLKLSFNLLFYLLMQILKYFLSSSAIMQWSFKAVHCSWKPVTKIKLQFKAKLRWRNLCCSLEVAACIYKLGLYMRLHTLYTNIGVKLQRRAFQGCRCLCQPQVVQLHHSRGASGRALKDPYPYRHRAFPEGAEHFLL